MTIHGIAFAAPVFLDINNNSLFALEWFVPVNVRVAYCMAQIFVRISVICFDGVLTTSDS